MSKEETIQIITLLAGNYDSIAKKDKTQKQLMVTIWQECLSDLNYIDVLQAVKKVIKDSPYPPTVNDIRRNTNEIKCLPKNEKYKHLYKNLEWCEMYLDEY